MLNLQHNDILKGMFIDATEGIIVSNTEGRLVLANPKALQMFGYTDQEMLENFIEIVKIDLKKADFDQLTTDENKAVEQAAVMTLSKINNKKKTEIAFQVLSKK